MDPTIAASAVTPTLALPPWLEYTVTGTLVLGMLWLMLSLLDSYRKRQATDLGVDKRVLQQLDERNQYVGKLESRNDQLYERNIELTNNYTSTMEDVIKRAHDFKDSIVRVHTVLQEVKDQCDRVEKGYSTLNTRVEANERMIAAVAVQAQPAATSNERVTMIGPAGTA